MRLATGVALAVLAAAPVDAQRYELRELVVPPPTEERVVPIGGTLYEHSRYQVIQVIEPEDWIEARILFAKVSIPPGARMIPVGTMRAEKACFIMNLDEIGGPYRRGCAIDDDGDGTFDRVAGNEDQGAIKLPVPVAYKRVEMRSSRLGTGFEHKLIYLGATADTLRLSYREFINDFARPAFTEELTIPIGAKFPMSVVVKDITLRIFGISSDGIRYAIM